MAPQQGPLPGGLPLGGAPGMGGAAPPANPAAPPPAPYRQLKVEDALAYLDQVKVKFDKQNCKFWLLENPRKKYGNSCTPPSTDVLTMFDEGRGHRSVIVGLRAKPAI